MLIGYPSNLRKIFLKEIDWSGENNLDFVEVFLEEDETSSQSARTSKVNFNVM